MRVVTVVVIVQVLMVVVVAAVGVNPGVAGAGESVRIDCCLWGEEGGLGLARGYLVWLWLCILGSMMLTLMWPAVGAALAFAAGAAGDVVLVVVVVDLVAAVAVVAVVLLVRVVVVKFALVVIVGWLSQSQGSLRLLFCVPTYWNVLTYKKMWFWVYSLFTTYADPMV